ncbi:MAG: high-potential iron-sulfur protein [Acetobacteraceae bacterium]
MNDRDSTDLTRRDALRRGALAAGAVALPALALGGTAAHATTAAPAYGTVPKSALHYVALSTNGSACEDCIQFIPGPKGSHVGHCKVVAGLIANKGWCQAFVHVPKGTPDTM